MIDMYLNGKLKLNEMITREITLNKLTRRLRPCLAGKWPVR